MRTQLRSQMGINANITFSNNEAQIALAYAMGATSIRIDFRMNYIQATQGVFLYDTYDTIVNTAALYGISILAIMDQYNCPSWALDSTPGANFMDKTQYNIFCQAVATHFGSKINMYELGNEPNFTANWSPAVDPAAYTALMQQGYAGIKAGNINTTVLTAGISGNPSATMAGSTFLTQMYTAGAHGYFDAFAIHPYSSTNGNIDFASIDSCKAILASNGDSTLPIYITELGCYTGTSTHKVTEAAQATFITDIYDLILTGAYQYIPMIYAYQMSDNGLTTSDPESNYGLMHNKSYSTPFLPKPAYYTYQAVATSLTSPFPTFFNS